MKSQTKLTLPTIASISTIIVTALISTAIISQSTSALTYQDSTDVKFTFNPTININLSSTDLVIPELTSGSSSDSNEVTVSVSTNTGYGYYLSATAGTKTGNTSLNNTLDSSYKFTNLTANAPSLSAMPDNSWGYSYSTDNGATWVSGDAGSTMTGYNGLPLDNDDSGATGIKLVSTDSFTSSSSIKFKIGAKSAPTQAAGTYTNTVNFYAVANPKPITTIENATTMQEVEACPETVPLEQVYTLIDPRDNKAYRVARLKDGKCWMLDNLALDLTDSTVQTRLNSNTTNATDLSISYLLGNTTRDPASTGPDKKYATSKVSTVWNSISNPGSTSTYSDSDPRIYVGASNDIPYNPQDSMAEQVQSGEWKTGVYYNFCAASSGSYCYGNGGSAGTSIGDAYEDVCPKGWRMPTGDASGEYENLYNIISEETNNSAVTAYRSALQLPFSGKVSSGTIDSYTSNGYWWASNRVDDYSMRVLSINSSFVSAHDYYARSFGYPIRCVLSSQ